MEEKKKHVVVVTNLEFDRVHGMVHGIIYAIVGKLAYRYIDHEHNREVMEFYCTDQELENITSKLTEVYAGKKYSTFSVK